VKGYFNKPEATEASFTEGWLHSGDVARIDDEGFVYIVDRAKDMIISGGFNVYSTEVEQALLAHPDVQDCAVIGVPDDTWGERVVAVVQPYAGRSADPDDVRAFVRERIGGVKAPKEVLVWGDLPRSKVGKVLKVDIRSSVLASHADE
jgi:acyl-CoA synthetase (AMP-forming)/AMP-acid ligase II